MKKDIIHIIAGPTASGKSARAIDFSLSKPYGKECVIINCDSMQIYDGLHILTAQPSPQDLEKVPHKLYSTLHPNDACSAGNWREMVEPIIYEVLAEDKVPVIVGGSGLYIKALMHGLSPIPDIPDEVRIRTVNMQKELGNPRFHAELAKRDPVMADRFHPYHTARLVRAWEVLEATGKSLAQWQQEKRIAPPDNWEFKVEIIIPERSVLHQRCNDRFLQMIENGVLEEVEKFGQRIEKAEVRGDIPLVKALGFRQLLSYIKGEIDMQTAIDKAQAKTRQYAKQQVTWFRNQI